MNNDELIALIDNEERQCISSTSGALAEQRREALQYYYGQPYGNEIEGRSQVVTTEVKDAVEGILPSLMAIFTSSEEIVRFEPENPEDEAAAQQATEYINYVFTRNNNGFLTLYCLFKDALLQKNGYAKVYWEDYSDKGLETYENLDALQAAMMLQDPELTLEESEVDPENPEVFKKAVFRRNKSYGKVCIDPVPPEEILISKETPNDLTKARFVEHKTRRTISKIREMGFEVPDDIADDSPNSEFNEERVERFKFDDADAFRREETTDPATREVWLCEAYLYVDFDEDGHAEYRKVTKIGKTILDNVEFDSLPVVGGTAILMPHKHYGLSIHDLVGDIQLIKSTITRTLLDNAYVANNGRMVVLDGMVNMDDLLQSRPNGIVRAKAMNAVQRLDNPLLGAPFYNLLEYFDQVKQNRVGSTDFPNAVDPDAINAKAAFVDAYKSAAMERVNLMARIFAETVVKQIFWKILELISKHQQKPRMVKLRNEWVNVDPREWRNKFNMTVTVGLGTGSQQTLLQGAMGILNVQMGMLKAGLGNRTVTEKNIFEAAKRYAKAVFPKDADSFFTNPETLPPPQPQPNIELMELQEKARKADMQQQQRSDQLNAKMASEEMNRQFQAQMEQFKAAMEDRSKQIDALMERASQERELQVRAMEARIDAESQQRQAMIDSIKSARDSVIQGEQDKEKMAFQGLIDQLLQQQKEQAEQNKEILKAMLAPREIVRDSKGKASGTRVSKE